MKWTPDDDASVTEKAYNNALANDPVVRCRSLVAACRASGQCREDFMATIEEANSTSAFPDGQPIRCIQLLRDVDTRWSSIFLMIDRVLELYPISTYLFFRALILTRMIQAIEIFLNKAKQTEIAKHALSITDLEVLRDICKFLEIPHAVQELLSAEKTPTIPMTIPMYESLVEMYKLLQTSQPRLEPAISAAISKIQEYVQKSRKTRVYALAMSAFHFIQAFSC